MPATAGRVRMPADNRLSVSDSLRTTEIWQKSVGYDPYAPTKRNDSFSVNDQIEEKAKGLFALARLTGSSSSTTPGACRKCNQVGHLTFQCRNTILLKDPVLPASSSKSPLTNEMDEARNDRRSVSKKSHKHHKKHHRRKSDHHHQKDSDSSSEDGSSVDERSRSNERKRKRRHRRSRSTSLSSTSSEESIELPQSRNDKSRDSRSRGDKSRGDHETSSSSESHRHRRGKTRSTRVAKEHRSRDRHSKRRHSPTSRRDSRD